MSSNVQHVDFRTGETRILREILRKAAYVTSNMKPLSGPLHHPSQSVIRRFMAGTMLEPAR